MTRDQMAACSRFSGLFLIWLALMTWSPASWAVGVLAALAATWWSLRLLPPAAAGIRFGLMCLLVPRFLWQSLLAGWDVALRALNPKMPLKTGFITFRCTYQKAFAHDSFATVTSLLPGTLPCDDNDGVLLYHCLDLDQPVVAQLAEEARRLAPVFGEQTDG
ncbi:MAG: Na+/H+ antiporter subunit E [Fluviibacter sp.]|jgi:multicomponent Na+:H+ antiporter subunit E